MAWRRVAGPLAAGLGAWALACGGAQAASLTFCDAPKPVTAKQQDRLLRMSALVRDELARSGASVALVARSGTNLDWIGQRYSHAGLSLRDSDHAPWAVRQLYYDCDEGRPLVFDQGLTSFLQGADNPALGFLTVLILPGEAGNAVARTALDKPLALGLLGGRYSANAYPFDSRYQNCNQWVAELLAVAWGSAPATPTLRQAAQHWLQAQGYRGTRVEAGALFGLSAFIPWTHSDDHPHEQLAETVFEVSMPESLAEFVRQRLPGTRRLEICHTLQHAVLRRDGPPLGDRCEPAPGDQVLALDAPR